MRFVWLIGVMLPLICLGGCGGGSDGNESGPVALCSNPVPVSGTFDPAAPGYIVLFNDGVDPQAETNRLATFYGFQPKFVYLAVNGFAAEFSADVLEHLRCEPTVKIIQHDGVNQAH